MEQVGRHGHPLLRLLQMGATGSRVGGCVLCLMDVSINVYIPQYGNLLMRELVAAVQAGGGEGAGEQPAGQQQHNQQQQQQQQQQGQQGPGGEAAAEEQQLRGELLCGHSATAVLERLVSCSCWGASGASGFWCALRLASSARSFMQHAEYSARVLPHRFPCTPHASDCTQGMLHLLRTSLPTLADPESAASHNLARPALHTACHAWTGFNDVRLLQGVLLHGYGR